jgi:hypothetical protein
LTYIRVIAELLNDRLMEVASITLESITDAEGVLDAREHLSDIGEVATLAQLEALLLALRVDVLNPTVVGGHSSIINVILEFNDV